MGAFPDLPVIDLAPGALLIGDLHLEIGGEVDRRIESFLEWLGQLEPSTNPRLVILGDLFEAWVGPAHARLASAEAVLAGLAELSARGVAIDLVFGNRDFLLGTEFSTRTGVTLFPQGFVGRLPEAAGEAGRVLCIHGDELCTLDLAYQRLKRVLRSRPATWLVPRLPDSVALWGTRRVRTAAREALKVKLADEKAQQAEAVVEWGGRYRCGTVLCGHAHEHRDTLVEGVRWVVLDAFWGRHDAVCVEAGGLTAVASGVRPPSVGP